MGEGKTGRLHRAAKAGDIKGVTEYFKMGAMRKAPGDVNKKDERGNTALLLAVSQSSVVCAQYLLQQKADVNLANDKGVTPLMAATNNNNIEVIKLLYAAGNINNSLRNCDGYTALLIACELGHLPSVITLCENKADILRDHLPNGANSLMLACSTGHVNIVEFCVKAGLDVNQTMSNGDTALMIAAVHNHIKVVQFLVANGANINAVNRDGRTVLSLCADLGHVDMAEELRKLGCSNVFPSKLTDNTKNLTITHWLAPCVIFGSNSQLMEQDCCCWCCFYSCLCIATPIAPCCLAASFRGRIRERYEIPGSTGGDIAAHVFCHCCALQQEREMLEKCPWERNRVRSPTITSPDEIGAYHKMS